MKTLQLAQSLREELIALRRELHAHPEIGLELPFTQQRVLDALAGLDIEITTGSTLSSVVGVIRGQAAPAGNKPVVLLRGDMDALPVAERTGREFASTNGAMHACGHDLHVAALVGAATILCQMRDVLPGDVVLMFQPGEEGPGGAKPMLEEGLLEAAGSPVQASFAWHVISGRQPKGVWFGRPGALMASADQARIRVVGRGGHGSAPHMALDPIPAACEMVLALQTMVTRSVNVFDPVVITVGKIAGGTKENIIGDDCRFEATVRTLSADNRQRLEAGIRRIVTGIAQAHGLTVEIDYEHGYPVTVNDTTEFELAKQTVIDMFGAHRWAEMPEPELGSEDMSFVQELVPGAYVFMSGCCFDDPSEAADNHSPLADFDDAVVPDAAAWLAEVALRKLRLLA